MVVIALPDILPVRLLVRDLGVPCCVKRRAGPRVFALRAWPLEATCGIILPTPSDGTLLIFFKERREFDITY